MSSWTRRVLVLDPNKVSRCWTCCSSEDQSWKNFGCQRLPWISWCRSESAHHSRLMRGMFYRKCHSLCSPNKESICGLCWWKFLCQIMWFLHRTCQHDRWTFLMKNLAFCVQVVHDLLKERCRRTRVQQKRNKKQSCIDTSNCVCACGCRKSTFFPTSTKKISNPSLEFPL